MNDDYSFLIEYKTRMAELQDIAAMDRLAAEMTPPSAMRRWAQQRRADRDGAIVRRSGGRPGARRRLTLG